MRKRLIALAICSISIFSIVAPMRGLDCRNDKRIEEQKQETAETEYEVTIESVDLHRFSMQAPNYSLCNVQNNETNKPRKEDVEEQLSYSSYWVSVDKLNVRKDSNKSSETIKKLSFNDEIHAAILDNGWAKIENDNGYVKAEYLSDKELNYTYFEAPVTSGFKSYMPHNLFSTKSEQYKLQEKCNTGTYGIRQYNGRFCVALGSHFNAEIGQYFDLILENGTVIPCIMADQKADCHTDSSNIVTSANGCMTEFVVDMHSLNTNAKRMGDISYCTDEWKSRVYAVKVYDEKVDLR